MTLLMTFTKAPSVMRMAFQLMSTPACQWMIHASFIGSALAQAPAPSPASKPTEADAYDDSFPTYLLVCLGFLAFTAMIYQIVLMVVRYIRKLVCLNANSQWYFSLPNDHFAWFKEHLLYAPLFRTRHRRELHLIKGWTTGVLPTRFQSLFLLVVVGLNIAFCVIGIEWSKSGTPDMLNHLRNRSGTLAVANMVPLVVMAGRNNPLIRLLNVSHSTFNLLHRWFGRIVVMQIIVHATAWLVKGVKLAGWQGVLKMINVSPRITTGVISISAIIFIMLQSASLLRKAFYETFLHVHIAVSMFALVGLWMHLDGLAAQIYVKIVIGAWALERFVRLISLLYRSVGNGGTQAVVEALPGDAMRVTIKMARPWVVRPGQHMFLTMPSIGLWTSHPFSVAWSGEEEHLQSEKGLVTTRQDVLGLQKTSISAIIRRRDGFTNALYKKAQKAARNQIVVSTFVEGPYGGLRSFHSYGTVMIFAAGVGITHQLPYIRDLVRGYGNGTCAARRVVLVWIIQSPEHLEWIRPWMTNILTLDQRRDILRIQLFVTKPRNIKEIHSPSSTVQMFPGRPNVDTLIGMEADNQIGVMAVTVCGAGGLADDVRMAVRKRQSTRNVDFVEETFGW